jgi:hypothetical protein
MVGLILVGLLGVLVVAIAFPLVLWSLSIETLRERAARSTHPRSVALAARRRADREAPRSFSTLSGAAA